MDAYGCDNCGRMCTRTHNIVACSMEGTFCDDCAHYEWEAYDDDADPLLYPDDPLEREDEERRVYYDKFGDSQP